MYNIVTELLNMRTVNFPNISPLLSHFLPSDALHDDTQLSALFFILMTFCL